MAYMMKLSETASSLCKLLLEHLKLMSQGRINSVCVCRVMLYASESWALRESDRSCLADKAMIRWICGVKVEDQSTKPLSIKDWISHILTQSLDNIDYAGLAMYVGAPLG